MAGIKKLSIAITSLLLISCLTTACDSSLDSSSSDEEFIIESNVNSSINYQIFVRSFADSNNDGIGDLKGIEQKIPYLKNLGVKNIWLTPIHKTSSDHGYDVIDYYSVADDLGGMEAFNSLINELHANNMNIIMDMVFNHVSNQSSYFKKAYQDFDSIQNGKPVENSYAKWFNFSTTSKGNYVSVGKYYAESNFNTSSMIDYNLNSAGVREEFKNILNFWAEKGVAGYRFDAVKYFYGQGFGNSSIEFCNYLKSIQPNLYFVGEGWDESTYTFKKYFNSDFDSFFSFPTSSAASNAKTNIFTNMNNKSIDNFYSTFTELQEAITASNTELNKNSIPSYFLSNHDMDRVSSRSSNDSQLKMVANLNYLLPGTPFIYYGEELGMKGVREDSSNTDANRRMPMMFEEEVRTNPLKGTTFKDQITSTTEDQIKDPSSMLRHYISLTSTRNKMGSMMKDATYSIYDSNYKNLYKYVYAYNLEKDNDKYFVINNLDSEPIDITLSSDYQEVIGFLPCMNNMDNYSLNGSNLTLPALSSIVFKK